MAISFNELPQQRPSLGTIIPRGQYIGKIVKAEMRPPKDETKPDYLNLEMDITDPQSSLSMGKVWAIISESEKPLPRYQLSRLIKALKLPITGSFELKDLTKMVTGKELRVDICPEERTDGKEAQRSIVDALSGEIFYPIDEEPEEELQMPTEAVDFPDAPQVTSQY